MSSATRIRREGPIFPIGVTTHDDLIWQVGKGPVHETRTQTVLNAKSLVNRYESGLCRVDGELVDSDDLDAMCDVVRKRARGESDPLCRSCRRASVVLGLDTCSACNSKEGDR